MQNFLADSYYDRTNKRFLAIETRLNSHDGSNAGLANRVTALEQHKVIQDNAASLLAIRVSTAETAVVNQATRITAAESTISAHTTSINGLSSRMTAADGGIATNTTDIAALKTRMSAAESTISGHTASINSNTGAISGLNIRVQSLETWRANKSPRSADMSTNPAVAGITLVGLGITVSKNSIDAHFAAVHAKLNEHSKILVDREMTL